ncbi:hypothetical protein [Pilimelia anulata]|nr:hypothetical protein [Pilimelia anulata]
MTQQYEDLTPPDHLDPAERDLEAPAADAIEQAFPANPADAPEELPGSPEANEWDAAEQARVVDLDDDYDR